MANSGFESMRNLPIVVESVHRKNARKVLESLKVSLPETATWQQMVDAVDGIPDPQGHVLNWVEYAGQVPVNGLFGLNDWRLVESRPSSQTMEVLDTYPNSFNDVHSQLYVILRRAGDEIGVLLMPDVAPVAMYALDIKYVTDKHRVKKPARQDNDAEILQAVQREFGEDAVYRLTERVARSLANALLNDESRTATVQG